MAGRIDEALKQIEKVDTLPGGPDVLLGPLYATYVMTRQDLLRHAGRHEEAERILDIGLARLNGFPDFLFERGNVRYRRGLVKEAIADFKACLLPPPANYTVSFRPGVTDQLPRLALDQIEAATQQRGRATVAACLIVKDEAANLPRVLTSLRNKVDEVVVIDTGSTDNSVSIAESSGAEVGYYEWDNDFSKARNVGLDRAQAEWILVIDADEELVIEDIQAFRAALDQPALGGYIFPIHNLRDDGTFQVQPMLRLFRNHPNVRFAGRLHEEVTRALELQNWQVAPLEGVHIRHHGYLKEAIQMRDKWTRNLNIAIAEAEAQPNSTLAWYNLGRSSLFTGQNGPASAAFEQVGRLLRAGEIMGEAPFCSYVTLYRRLLLEAARDAEAEALLALGLERVPGFPDFHYERGLLRAARGELLAARADFEACMASTTRYFTGSMREGVRDELPRAALAKLGHLTT
jgi:tetratricopeptide (TPR) repeat protein